MTAGQGGESRRRGKGARASLLVESLTHVELHMHTSFILSVDMSICPYYI